MFEYGAERLNYLFSNIKQQENHNCKYLFSKQLEDSRVQDLFSLGRFSEQAKIIRKVASVCSENDNHLDALYLPFIVKNQSV